MPPSLPVASASEATVPVEAHEALASAVESVSVQNTLFRRISKTTRRKRRLHLSLHPTLLLRLQHKKMWLMSPWKNVQTTTDSKGVQPVEDIQKTSDDLEAQPMEDVKKTANNNGGAVCEGPPSKLCRVYQDIRISLARP